MTMNRDAHFWISLATFPAVFGLAVFDITRDYYVHDANTVRAQPSTAGRSALVWPDGITESDIAQLS